jgi:kanamycin kinase
VNESEVTVPAPVVAAAGGREVSLVWVNEAGGLTFAVGEGAGRCFIKWAPAGSGLDLSGEASRLAWARQYHLVPQPLGHGHDGTGSWLVTAALPGDNAVSARWKSEPAAAVVAIGEGLRALHEALPAASCPFSWHPCHQALTVATALQYAAEISPPDKLVVCHGDACAPNTLLGEDGRWVGHVDLGLLGIADRWADLAVATWSAEWNYGPGWDELLFDAYGIRPDPERTRYYRLL